MSAYKRTNCSADKDRGDKQGDTKACHLDSSVAFHGPSDCVIAVHESMNLPVASTLTRHRFRVEHDWLTVINLHGAPHPKR